MSDVDPQARPGARLLQGLDELAADLGVGRPPEGRQQPVDLQRPGGPHRVGQGEQLVAAQRRPGQHVGGEDPGRGRDGPDPAVRQEGEDLGRGLGQAAGDGRQRLQPDVVRGRRGAADAEQGLAEPLDPLLRCRQGTRRRRGLADGLGVVARQDVRQGGGPRARDAPSARPGPSPGGRSIAPHARPNRWRRRSASKSWTASDGASRASWSRSSAALGLAQALRPSPAARGGSRPARRPTRGGGRRSTRRSPSGRARTRRAGGRPPSGSSPPPFIWSSAIRAARRVPASLAGEPGPGGLRVGDLDQGVGQRVLQDAVIRRRPLRPGAPARPTCRRSARGPRRRRAGCAASSSLSSRDQLRGRVAVAPDARRVARRLADRLVGIVQARPGDGAGVGVVDPRRGPDGVPPGLGRTARSGRPPPAPGRRRRPSSPRTFDGPPADRRPGVVQQGGRARRPSSPTTPASGRAGRRPSARPCVGRGRSRPARRA